MTLTPTIQRGEGNNTIHTSPSYSYPYKHTNLYSYTYFSYQNMYILIFTIFTSLFSTTTEKNMKTFPFIQNGITNRHVYLLKSCFSFFIINVYSCLCVLVLFLDLNAIIVLDLMVTHLILCKLYFFWYWYTANSQ